MTFDLLTLKVVSESHVTCATSVPILVFIGPMYATDVRRRQTSDRHYRLMPPPRGRAGHNKVFSYATATLVNIPFDLVQKVTRL